MQKQIQPKHCVPVSAANHYRITCRALSSSTINPVVVAGMRKAFWKTGKVTCWSMTMAATKLCSPKNRRSPELNWLVGRTHARRNFFDLHQANNSLMALDAYTQRAVSPFDSGEKVQPQKYLTPLNHTLSNRNFILAGLFFGL